ncbi:hypothetical protein BUALT_Bualt03G0036800 [Buddleja alternifolia]|uniref:SGNH hydrolase-type esterase domain-containing protein n=1 Tax=Buddleja alternifolia TaxID=168488 RepID=A0AAV6XT30_9LAMI|nr:hypothetical protein BUALT_Bualt03G0036800 [Buddleja alternifolia]
MEINMAKILFVIFFFLVSNNLVQSVYGETLVPCYFIFGDSLVDNGNNNDRNTVAKANYPPYGIDYPTGPTGRFTNGRNVADTIAELLGFSDHIPPFVTASGNATLNGVNYGSGGAGILDETGKQLVALLGLFQIGCVPAAIKRNITGTSCTETTNDAAQIFNTKLKSLIDVLNKDLIGAKFIYVDTYGITASDPASVTGSPRTDFAYFDALHPTEAAAAIVAKRAFTAQSPSDAYPMDIQHLAQT